MQAEISKYFLKTPKTKPQKIKPQLLIYPSSQNSEYIWRGWSSSLDQRKIKYRLYSKESSKDNRKYFQKRQPALPILNVTHTLSHCSSFDNDFLKFLTKTRNIKKLTLKITNYSWQDETCRYHWRYKEPEKKFTRVIRKIFVLCLRVQKVHIHISSRDYSNGLPFPFRCLRFAKSLKHLNCSLYTSYFPDFQYLENYLSRASRRGLKHTTSFVFNPATSYRDGRFRYYSPDEVQKIIERIVDLSKNPSIKFFLDLNYSSMYKDIISFTEIFAKLQNLTELKIHPKLDHCIPKILKNFQNPGNLTKLSLQFGSSEFLNEYPYYEDSGDYGYYDEDVDDSDEFYYPLDHLVYFISKAKSLTILDLTFKDVDESRPLIDLADELKECQELTSLSIKFERCRWIEDSIFISLIESLESLPKLMDLTLSCPADSFRTQHPKSPGLQGFFKSIEALKNLRSLDLSCDGSSSNSVSDGDFIVLCRSLRSLKQLEKLKISMPNCNIEEKGVTFLSTIIPKLKQLQTFNLNIKTSKDNVISAKEISQLLESFVRLRCFSNLSLSFKCSDISLSSTKLLVTNILNLKSLKNLYLDLATNNDWDPDVSAYLSSVFEHLRMKIEASHSCGSAKNKNLDFI